VTATIPIVVGTAADLVGQGLVESLARPGGNLTGLDLCVLEPMGRRLDLLKEALPTISHVVALANPTNPIYQEVPHSIEPAARALGVQLQCVEAKGRDDSAGAFIEAFQ
jgi:putative ABC transport system substrate-binding protein